MRGLIFDPFAGISGDMILGGLVDLGLDAGWLRAFVASLGLGEISVHVDRVERQAISCVRVRFEVPHEHAHRHLPAVLDIVRQCGAAEEVKSLACTAFRRLAEAEAAVHGIAVDEVHFHEVGALDAILDVLCAIAGVRELGFEAFHARPVALGSGWIDVAHGHFPVPAPATLKLLEGHAVRESGLEGECTTPTGAAILTTLVAGKRPPDELRVLGSGYGAGSRDPTDRPNCLRLITCELPAGVGERLHVVQADVDDLPAEYVPPAQDALLEAGALDAVVSPVGMKKGRPGLRLEALVPDAALYAVIEALFESTSTIGARHWPVTRPALPREDEVVEWRGQRLRRKRVRLPSGTERAKPEYDDVVRAAKALGVPPFRLRLALEGDDHAAPNAAASDADEAWHR